MTARQNLWSHVRNGIQGGSETCIYLRARHVPVAWEDKIFITHIMLTLVDAELEE